MATAVIAAHAADVTWTGGGDGFSWTDSNNWDGGAEPTSEDNVRYPNSSVTWDLGGKSSVKQIASLNYATAGKNATWTFSNGALDVLSGSSTIALGNNVVLDNANLSFGASSTLYLSQDQWNGSRVTVTIKAGSVFKVDGQYHPRRVDFIVERGGRYVYGKSTKLNNCNANVLWTITNSGTLEFEKGITGFNNAWSAPGKFVQVAGEMILGGPVKKTNNIYWQFDLQGGKVTATDNVTFANQGNGWTKFSDGADVVLEAASGKTLDMSCFTYDGTAKVTLVGAGEIKLKSLPPHLVLDGASLSSDYVDDSAEKVAIDSSSSVLTVNAQNLHIGELASFAGEIAVHSAGLQIDTVADDIDLSLGTFSCVGLASDEVVLISDSSALLAKAKSDLQTAGLATVIDGNVLKIPPNTIIFDSTSVTDFSSPDGWSTGSTPGAGADVTVSGAGVRAIISSTVPEYSRISVENGAVLEIACDMTLPRIRLAADAKFVIAEGVSVVLGELVTQADENSLSIVEIGTGAVVQTSQTELIFTDVDLRLNGVIQNTVANANIYFGYADVINTKFALMVNGGGFANADGASIKNLYFMKALNGGTVSAIGDAALTLEAMDFSAVEDIRIGEGNPEDLPFDLVFDNTTMSMSHANRDLFIRGASRVHLRNGARIDSGMWDVMSLSHVIAMSQSASLIVEENGLVSKSVGSSASNDGYNTGRGQFAISATTKGHDSVVLKEGGIFRVYGTGGNGKSRVVADGGIWQYYRDHWSEEGATDIFKGFTEVHVTDGKTLTIQCAKPGTIQDWGWTRDRHATIANVPITGTGDVVIDNEADTDIFECTLTCGNNTATGSLSMNPNKKATLFFKNGCNWVGKVVANGATQFTGDTAAEVTFGSVDLQEEFPLRVLGIYDEETKTATITGNDKVNITDSEGWIDNGGQIAVQFPEAFTANDLPVSARIPLGTIPVGAQLPKVRRADHLVVYTEAIEGDAEHLIYGLKPNRGFTISFR